MEKWGKQAHEDWSAILRARAEEMVDGGKLLVSALAVDDNGRYAS